MRRGSEGSARDAILALTAAFGLALSPPPPAVAQDPALQPIRLAPSPELPPPPGAADFLSVEGNALVDSRGDEVRLTGINWFGFETDTLAVHGLHLRDYRSMLRQIRDLGFNMVRLPWSNAIFEPGAEARGIAFGGADPYDGTGPLNEPLWGKTPLEVLDLIVEEAGELGLRVILDNHSRKPNNYAAEPLWYLEDFPEERWIADWVTLARRYRGEDTVVAFDLDAEPHGQASWGSGDLANDWKAAAERAAAAVHAVHPEVLVLVEGVLSHRGNHYWWGGNLQGAREHPAAIDPVKCVYSTHDYGPEVYPQPWFFDPAFPDNLVPLWDEMWGYLHDEGLAPVFVGEFGIDDREAFDGVALAWVQHLLDYMGSTHSWAYWSWNPNSAGTGGLLGDDWLTVHDWKMDLLAPYLAPPAAVTPPR